MSLCLSRDWKGIEDFNLSGTNRGMIDARQMSSNPKQLSVLYKS